MNARSRRAALAGIAAASLVAGAGLTAAPAAADPVNLTLEYSCVYPLIGKQRLTVKIKSDIPKSIPINTPTPKIEIDALSTIYEETWSGLNLIGAASLEGTASAASTVEAPQGNLNLKVPITLEKVAVPAEQKPFDIHGTGAAPSIRFSKAGKAKIKVNDLVLSITPRDSDGAVVDVPDEPDGTSMKAVKCTLEPNQDNVLATVDVTDGSDPDTTPPSVPGNVKATATKDTATLTWDASTDDKSGVAGYEVFDKDGKSVATSTSTTATVPNLTPETEYTFTVKAKDKAGNVSAASAPVTVTTDGGDPDPDTAPPSVPANVTGTASSNSVSLDWDDSTDDKSGVAGYEVTGGPSAVSATDSLATVPGLTPDTEYTFTVKAKDKAGNVSDGATLTIRTKPKDPGGGVKYGYTIKGSTFVKAPNGNAPLTGSIDAVLDLASGNYTADLVLAPTKGDFKILGFLPVQAGIVLEPQGKTTGTLKGGVLTANSKVITKLPSFTAFGIPLGGGEKCQTAQPSDIPLVSTGKFEPLKGGNLKGEYALSEIKDCGPLTPILSAFTAGKGNTINLDLTPKPRA